MMRVTLFIAVALAACAGPEDPAAILTEDQPADAVDVADPGFTSQAVCAPGTESVYTLDADGRLERFQPNEGLFVTIGQLHCPAEATGTPRSMAIDHAANAWVLYSSGELFRVNTSTLKCVKTAFQPQHGI